jgi:hypothetical protein
MDGYYLFEGTIKHLYILARREYKHSDEIAYKYAFHFTAEKSKQ